MPEKTTTIINPLTIIAIFAGVIETLGAFVVPKISTMENQKIIIQFLADFPFTLVWLFFITLWFRHKVLYAPSDFKNENHFFGIGEPANVDEVINKVNGEVDEVVGKINNKNKINDSDNSPKINFFDYRQAEKQAFNKLEKELKLNFKRDVKITDMDGKSFIFDGLCERENVLTAIEFKIQKNIFTQRRVLDITLDKMYKSIKDACLIKSIYFEVILVIAVEELSEDKSDKTHAIVNELRNKYPFRIELKIYDLKSLIHPK